jgi:diaminopimelate decarboxylase
VDFFEYRDRTLYCEDVPVPVLAEQYGTPLWVYSQRTLLQQLKELHRAFAGVNPLICYSLKTNGNLAICRVLHEKGCGFDVTSGGELFRALKAGGQGKEIVFAGAGKTEAEMRMGLDAGVLMFNVESDAELALLARVAAAKQRVAAIALRVNPDVDPHTHVKTTTGKRGTKFGLDWDRIIAIARALAGNKWIQLQGLHMHLGSPILTTEPYRAALERARPLVLELRAQGHPLTHLNVGGGFGINYRKREALAADAFAEVIVPAARNLSCRLILEPGRFIAGNAGILLSRVIYCKESGGRRFVIQDAAMNDLIRPTLYDAFHRIWPVHPAADVPAAPDDFEAAIPNTQPADVVGPVCESGDYLARDRNLPAVRSGDLLATFSAGAYGMAMSSNYNGRCRAAEVLVDGEHHRLIRRRETFEDLIQTEL